MDDWEEIFIRNLNEHKQVMDKIERLAGLVEETDDRISSALKTNVRVFFCGNGGSAADAQHQAAELSGRYLKDRNPLDGITLHCNTSTITARPLPTTTLSTTSLQDNWKPMVTQAIY